MSLYDSCAFNGLQLNGSSTRAIREINNISDLSNSLALLASAMPLIEIFSSRASVLKISNKITSYDWEQFGQAVVSIGNITRRRIEAIADEQAIYNSDEKNKKFWRCVSNALR